MENAPRFLANHRPYASIHDSRTPYDSLSSQLSSNASASRSDCQQQSPHFSRSGPVESPLFQPLSPETERPLDDFDRQLLRESQGHHRHPERSRLSRAFHPPKPITPLMTGSRQTPLQNDLHELPMHLLSSSSPIPMTSPTVSALQNRQQSRATIPLYSKTSNVAPEGPPHEEVAAATAPAPSVNKIAKQRGSQFKPPLKKPPIIQGIPLIPATALPDQIRSVFGFEIFNAVQSKCFASAFKSDDNLVVSAPTGSGKTVIMELAICRLVAECKGQDFKVVYQAPTKSLCAERYNDWQKKFSILNLDCAELTGDTSFDQLGNVQKASIIITTPEKWDSVTRKWKDHAKLMHLVRLFLVDEVHILRDERGATLEAVVSRMNSVVSNIRFIALSATVPNSEDIAIWLGKNSTTQHLPAHREVFGETFRPVQLKKHVYGFEAKSNDFAFDSMLTQKIPDIIANHGHGKPVMIFCSTRRASATTAKMLAEMWLSSHPLQRLWRGPDGQLLLTNPDLKATAVAGVAFHHGGLSLSDRRTVEQSFLNGQINIICSTSTLAVGVNLPCYLVILKGTCAWTDSGLKEYADLEVMQMLGRAGRPQFETSACAVILTRKEKIPRYEKMVSGEEVLESCLHQNLIEHLNAEIVLGTVHDVPTAKQWLASTFLYVRLQKNPSHYQFREGVEESTDDELLEQLCKKDIDLLLGAGIVEEKTRLTTTMFGEAMARYYVTFDTMKSFIGLPPKAKMSETLSLLAQAREFREVRMQAGEKSFYKEINKAPEIKFPIKVDIALPAHKISLLLQAELGNVALPDGENHRKHHQQYRIDKIGVFAHANRLIRCLIDCQIQLEDAISARHALELGRSLAAHVWDNTASQLRQIEGLGEVAVRKLAAASINSIDTLLNTEPSRIEVVLGKNPPFGHHLLKKLESFPQLRISVQETSREIQAGKGATVKVKAEVGFLNEVLPERFNKKTFSVCFLAEDSYGSLVEFRRFGAKKLEGGEQVCLTLPLTKPTNHVNCYVMCDNIAGTSKYAELSLSDIPASIYPVQLAQKNSTNNDMRQSLDEHSTLRLDDDFGDGGIDDQDLLAVDADCSKIEVIEDIDAILETEDNKMKSSKPEHDEDSSTVYREPTRLPNGRWTCQHDCSERDKNCKHKCCREGVVRPKRRSKAEVRNKEEEHSQKKITAMASMQPKTESVQEPRPKTETEIHRNSSHMPTTQPKEGRLGKRTRSFGEAQSAPLRSFSNGTSGRNIQKHEPATKRSKQSKDYKSDFWGDEPEIGSQSDRSSSMAKKQPPEKKIEIIKEDLFAAFDDDDDLFDLSFGDTELPDDQSPFTGEAPSARENTRTFQPSTLEKNLAAVDQDSFDFLTSDMDLGGFDPPLEHVAMSDVLKKNRSPSGDQTAIENPLCLPVATGFEQDFSSIPADLRAFLTDQERQVDEVFGNQAEDVMMEADSPAESFVKTPGDMESSATKQASAGVDQADSDNETQAEQQKRVYEEDQKKKWEGIDQWIYDEFHDYVELV